MQKREANMYWYFSFVGLFFIIYIINKVKLNLFSEEKSLFWLLGGFSILFLSLFPHVIVKLSYFIGIDYPPSLLFLLSSLFLIYVTFRQEQDISQLNERVKELAQKNALLEQTIREIEKSKSN